jgi:hypothetical protein
MVVHIARLQSHSSVPGFCHAVDPLGRLAPFCSYADQNMMVNAKRIVTTQH